MIWRPVRLAILALLLCVSVPGLSSGADIDITGVYQCEGANPDGTSYRGVVKIVGSGGTYRVTWVMGQRTTSVGIGLVRDGLLTVSYVSGGNLGIIVYRILKGPQLVGEWTLLGADPDVFPETLTKLGTSVRSEPDSPGVPRSAMR